MTYVVTAPYVMLRVSSSEGVTLRGFHVNAPVPDGVNADDLARHLRKGMVAKVADPVAVAEAEPAVNPWPKPSASKEDWVAYAVTRRAEDASEEAARAAAEAKTKAQLIEEFGKPADES